MVLLHLPILSFCLVYELFILYNRISCGYCRGNQNDFLRLFCLPLWKLCAKLCETHDIQYAPIRVTHTTDFYFATLIWYKTLPKLLAKIPGFSCLNCSVVICLCWLWKTLSECRLIYFSSLSDIYCSWSHCIGVTETLDIAK